MDSPTFLGLAQLHQANSGHHTSVLHYDDFFSIYITLYSTELPVFMRLFLFFLAANALWNNIMEPVGRKSTDWSKEFDRFVCPTDNRPYISTWKNSEPWWLGNTPQRAFVYHLFLIRLSISHPCLWYTRRYYCFDIFNQWHCLGRYRLRRWSEPN